MDCRLVNVRSSQAVREDHVIISIVETIDHVFVLVLIEFLKTSKSDWWPCLIGYILVDFRVDSVRSLRDYGFLLDDYWFSVLVEVVQALDVLFAIECIQIELVCGQQNAKRGDHYVHIEASSVPVIHDWATASRVYDPRIVQVVGTASERAIFL
jgi:hypothetical protein